MKLPFKSFGWAVSWWCAVAVLMVIGVLAVVNAGHTDEHTEPYLWRPPLVASNVSMSESIRVCSNLFPIATATAVSVWNEATSAYTSQQLFVFDPTLSNCAVESTDRVSSVVVVRALVNCGEDSPACTEDGGRNTELGTFINRMTVHIMPAYHDADDSPERSSYWPLVRDIAHELGHALGLAHYRCNEEDAESVFGNEVLGGRPAVMNYATRSGDCNVATWSMGPVALTSIDIADFMAAYYGSPALPKALEAIPGNGRVVLRWAEATDAPSIDGYRYRVDEGDWQDVSGSDASTTSYVLDDLKNGESYAVDLQAVRGFVPSGSSSVLALPSVKVPPVVPDPSLRTLELSGVSFDFDPTVTSYGLTVDEDLSRTTVTATKSKSRASFTIAPDDADLNTDGHQVRLDVGVTIIKVAVTDLDETRAYTVTVTRPDPFVAPVIESFTVSGTTLTGQFTWTGSDRRFLQWRLLRASSRDDPYSQVGTQDDSVTPVVFSGQSQGYWYKLSGRACETRIDPGAQRSGVRGQQAPNLGQVCKGEIAESLAIEIKRPTRPSDRTRTDRTEGATAWRVSGARACEWQLYVDQDQVNRAEWDAEDQAWEFYSSGWSDVGSPRPGSYNTGNCENSPPDQTRTVRTNTGTKWIVSGATACLWQHYVDQDQVNSAVWDGDSWEFYSSGWSDVGSPTPGSYNTGNCETSPPDQTRTVLLSSTLSWRVSGNIAYQQRTRRLRDDVRPYAWIGSAWSLASAWSFGTPYMVGPTDTGNEKVQPLTKIIPLPTEFQTETRTTTVFTGPSSCVMRKFQRVVQVAVRSITTYSWVEPNWVGSNSIQRSVTGHLPWRLVSTLPCRFGGVSGAQGEAGFVLPAGDYVLEWGETQIVFTVPAGSTVRLDGRMEAGKYVAVFKQGEAELVVTAQTLSGVSGQSAPEDPTLAAIMASLHRPKPSPSSVTTDHPCVVAGEAGQSATALNLDAEPCVVVRNGGAVNASLGDSTRSLTLPAGREWLLTGMVGKDETPAIAIIDLTTGGYLIIKAADGLELSRALGEGGAALGALFDAMLPSKSDSPS